MPTRSGGSSSRTIPNASGRIAPPMPWMIRPATRTVIDGASAHTTVPTAKPASEITISRFLR